MLGAMLEAPVEYYFLDSLLHQTLWVRMCAEGLSLVTKSVSVFILVRYFQIGLLAYAASNLVYSVTLLTVYIWFTPKSEPLKLK